MNKKIFLLVFIQIYLFTNVSFAQCDCNDIDRHISSGAPDWEASHGILTFPNNNSPLSPSNTNCIRMSSFLSEGDGAFSCYEFKQGTTYQVCFWVRNNSGWPSNFWGRVYVYAANGLTNTGKANIPSIYNKQLIDHSYLGPGQSGASSPSGAHPWEFISVSFTPNQDYSQIWIYPDNPQGPAPPGNAQWNDYYVVEVDDIRIEESPTTPSFSISTTKDTIEGCDDATNIVIGGMPANTIAIWDPYVPPRIPGGIGDDVIASPCETTVYKIQIIDSNTNCASCIRVFLRDTIFVKKWSDPDSIIYPKTITPCLSDIVLDYADSVSCSQIKNNHYTWIDPKGNPLLGKFQRFTADATHTGEWTLQIWNVKKNCYEEQKFHISVGSCCQSYPSFTYTGTNPVTFTNTSTGIISHVGTLWDFGDGTSSSAYDPVHSYDFPNDTVIQVCLTMLYEDGQGEGCCDQHCEQVPIEANSTDCAVSADFTFEPTPGGFDQFDFYNLSTGSDILCDYEWWLDQNPPFSTMLPTFSHQFPTPGPWKVCMRVTNCQYDAQGNVINMCQDSICKTVYPVTEPAQNQIRNARANYLKTESRQSVSGTSEAIKNDALAIYPNPNTGNFTLGLKGRTGDYNVVVRDATGKEVYNQYHSFKYAPVKINIENVSNGIYFVEVTNDTQKYVEEITINK